MKEGDKVKLDVSFKGQPEPIVKWYRDDSEIQSSTDFEISYTNEGTSLSIAEAFPEDSGRFKCVITNADSSATSEANLLVLRKLFDLFVSCVSSWLTKEKLIKYFILFYY